MLVNDIKIIPKKKMIKSNNTAADDLKIYQKMKSKF